jgi:sigma-54 dependent transcriptional regulator, acetoin dehydrogenase operon transcriptional activator AcoR
MDSSSEFSAEARVAHAHSALCEKGTIPADLLTTDISESWRRCIAAGLDPMKPQPVHFDDVGLFRARRELALLRGLALAEMHTLHQQIAGSNFMIAFATPDSMLLDIVSDQNFADGPDADRLRPGTVWSEAYCGTNALGVAARTKRSVTVHGSEHFYSRFTGLTCMASPVFAPDGALAGILDASSDCRSRQTHTGALVAMAAAQIENGLLRERHYTDIIIAFHSRAEYLRTMSTGLLAISQDGKLLASNSRARLMLQGLPVSPNRWFQDIFRTPFGEFISQANNRSPQRLEDQHRSSFFATLEFGVPQSGSMLVTAKMKAVVEPKPAAPILAGAVGIDFVADDCSVALSVRQVEAAAQRRMPILVRGETGTGKEQLARFAHRASKRKGEFIAVNCAALPDSLVEAELFGYADGAFTGARKGGSIGLARQADGGTLFLDEIGDMPMVLQAVLLRFLDDWIVRPVGGKPEKADVLLVSATNLPMENAIAEGRFRSDLLFRLNTLDVTLPPLGARSDFAAIARHLLRRIDSSFTITDAAISRLAARTWRGNIRELRNTLARLTLDCEQREIGVDEIEPALVIQVPDNTAVTLRDLQQQKILRTYSETSGNVAKTARLLGVSRNTVYRALGQQRGRH